MALARRSSPSFAMPKAGSSERETGRRWGSGCGRPVASLLRGCFVRAAIWCPAASVSGPPLWTPVFLKSQPLPPASPRKWTCRPLTPSGCRLGPSEASGLASTWMLAATGSRHRMSWRCSGCPLALTARNRSAVFQNASAWKVSQPPPATRDGEGKRVVAICYRIMLSWAVLPNVSEDMTRQLEDEFPRPREYRRQSVSVRSGSRRIPKAQNINSTSVHFRPGNPRLAFFRRQTIIALAPK